MPEGGGFCRALNWCSEGSGCVTEASFRVENSSSQPAADDRWQCGTGWIVGHDLHAGVRMRIYIDRSSQPLAIVWRGQCPNNEGRGQLLGLWTTTRVSLWDLEQEAQKLQEATTLQWKSE